MSVEILSNVGIEIVVHWYLPDVVKVSNFGGD